MIKFLRFFLTAKRKRRRLALGAALCLLRMLRDIEYDEMLRYEVLIDKLDCGADALSQRKHLAAEEEWSVCECALGFIDYVVDDLEMVFNTVY